MIRRPPRSTRTDTLFPYTALFRSDGKAHAISLCKAAPSDSGGQQAEPMAARAPSVSSPAITPHVEPERPIGLGEPRREKITPQGFLPHWLGWSIAALSILAVAAMPYGSYQLLRSEVRRVGKECVSTGRSGGA